MICPANTRGALPIDMDKLPVPPPGPRVPGVSYGGVFNTNGWPAGIVRMGTSTDDPGMPLGVQVVAQPWRDDIVLATLAFLEQRSGGYQKPSL